MKSIQYKRQFVELMNAFQQHAGIDRAWEFSIKAKLLSDEQMLAFYDHYVAFDREALPNIIHDIRLIANNDTKFSVPKTPYLKF